MRSKRNSSETRCVGSLWSDGDLVPRVSPRFVVHYVLPSILLLASRIPAVLPRISAVVATRFIIMNPEALFGALNRVVDFVPAAFNRWLAEQRCVAVRSQVLRMPEDDLRDEQHDTIVCRRVWAWIEVRRIDRMLSEVRATAIRSCAT